MESAGPIGPKALQLAARVIETNTGNAAKKATQEVTHQASQQFTQQIAQKSTQKVTQQVASAPKPPTPATNAVMATKGAARGGGTPFGSSLTNAMEAKQPTSVVSKLTPNGPKGTTETPLGSVTDAVKGKFAQASARNMGNNQPLGMQIADALTTKQMGSKLTTKEIGDTLGADIAKTGPAKTGPKPKTGPKAKTGPKKQKKAGNVSGNNMGTNLGNKVKTPGKPNIGKKLPNQNIVKLSERAKPIQDLEIMITKEGGHPLTHAEMRQLMGDMQKCVQEATKLSKLSGEVLESVQQLIQAARTELTEFLGTKAGKATVVVAKSALVVTLTTFAIKFIQMFIIEMFIGGAGEQVGVAYRLNQWRESGGTIPLFIELVLTYMPEPIFDDQFGDDPNEKRVVEGHYNTDIKAFKYIFRLERWTAMKRAEFKIQYAAFMKTLARLGRQTNDLVDLDAKRKELGVEKFTVDNIPDLKGAFANLEEEAKKIEIPKDDDDDDDNDDNDDN